MNYIRNIGKSLMMPIAVLPAAAILAGVGNWLASVGMFPVVASILFMAGTAILDNMGVLFAIGLAYGLSKDKNGAATLPAIVMIFITFKIFDTESLIKLLGLDPDSAATSLEVLQNQIGVVQAISFTKLNNAFIGILIGIISAELYNKFYKVELPKALSFFSGRRLVPIIAAIVAIFLGIAIFYIWPIIFVILERFGESLVGLGPLGAGIYGFLNRLLIPTGLHHALNTVFWFDVAGINDIGNYLGCNADNFNAATQVCLVGADKTTEAVRGVTGMYQAGFYPIMMFGLPGAALAIYHTSLPQNKKKVGSIMLAGAFASFFTGVTEPLEFSFMFVAWPLYVLHAFLTGLSLFIASALHYINGFGFSAGLVDYVLNFSNPLAVKPYMLIVQGAIFGVLYYFLFKWSILKFKLLTPGRTIGEFDQENEEDTENTDATTKYAKLALGINEVIGRDNLVEIDNCATRLRLIVKDSSIINDAALKKLGVAGVIKPNNTSIQIIIGPHVEFVADELKAVHQANQ